MSGGRPRFFATNKDSCLCVLQWYLSSIVGWYSKRANKWANFLGVCILLRIPITQNYRSGERPDSFLWKFTPSAHLSLVRGDPRNSFKLGDYLDKFCTYYKVTSGLDGVGTVRSTDRLAVQMRPSLRRRSRCKTIRNQGSMWWSTLFSSTAAVAAAGHRPLIPSDLKLATGGGHHTFHPFMHPVEISSTVGVDCLTKYLSSLCYSGLLHHPPSSVLLLLRPPIIIIHQVFLWEIGKRGEKPIISYICISGEEPRTGYHFVGIHETLTRGWLTEWVK